MTYKKIMEECKKINDLVAESEKKLNDRLDTMLEVTKAIELIPSYEEWKDYMQEKHTISKELHCVSPMIKPTLRKRLYLLERIVMRVPEKYWNDYVKEFERKDD